MTLLKAISALSHPVLIFPLLIVLDFQTDTLPHMLVVLTLSFLLPFAYFLYLYTHKKISDFDITQRTQRYTVFGVTLLGLLLSLPYLYIFANMEIFLSFAKLLLLALVLVALNFRIKVSIHTALITLLCFTLTRDFQVHLAIFLLVPLVAASRLALKRHRPLELLLGALVPAVFYVW